VLAGATGEPSHEVVWWDPKALALGASPRSGLRREDAIAKDVPPTVVAEGAERHRAWATKRASAIAEASRPSCRVVRVTEWVSDGGTVGDAAEDVAAQEVAVLTVPRADRRPAGPAFGTLVHAVLANVRVADAQVELDMVARTQGRLVGATSDEIEAARDAVARVVDHPVWHEARAAARASEVGVWREAPVTLVVGDVLVEGVVDLAYLLEGTVTVVDFKTDRAGEPGLDQYKRQVAAYATAFSRATGRPTRAILLQV
jgi:ATP-dependent exoDNAse (exonuclease V) beta subunit